MMHPLHGCLEFNTISELIPSTMAPNLSKYSRKASPNSKKIKEHKDALEAKLARKETIILLQGSFILMKPEL